MEENVTGRTEATTISSDSANDGKYAESTKPSSTSGSQGQPSLVSLSVEERLRRARAAEELRQKQRYEAYMESQRQAELARLKAQEDRKKKIEAIHQRAEARRQSVLERRKELELNSKARLDSLLERSRAREQAEQSLNRRRHTESFGTSSRTSSASPSFGSARHPNPSMTTSCVVAFGRSIPRSTFFQNRSTSSNECNKLGRPPTAPSSQSGDHLKKKPATTKSVPTTPLSVTASSSASVVGSSRSNSSDTLANRRATSRSIPSVFERLTAKGTGRTRSNRTETINEPPNVPVKLSQRPSTGLNKRFGSGFNTLPSAKGMSMSMYSERSNRKVVGAPKKSTLHRQRSLSPPVLMVNPEQASDDASEPASNSTAVSCEPVLDITPSEPAQATDDASAPDGPLALPEASAEVLVEVPPEQASTTVEAPASISPTLAAHSGPLQAETQGAGEGALLNEREKAIYRAKLLEQRRLAKERKEEEQRRLEELEAQRRIQEEAERLVAEQAEREQAELAAQQAAEAQRRREEEEKARLREAEAERLAKLQKAEEERNLRKQRLLNIMARVKPVETSNKITSSEQTLNADPAPHPSSSSPLLTEQGQADTDSRGDASDSLLFTHQSGTSPNVSSLRLSEDDTTTEMVSESSDVKNSPVSFTLGAEAASPARVISENQIQQPIASETVQANGTSSQFNGSVEVFQTSPTSSSVDLDTSPRKSTATDNSSTPKFKSALLQSMLGGGRLTTRAKDAVQDMRSQSRGRDSSSELSDSSPSHMARSTMANTSPHDAVPQPTVNNVSHSTVLNSTLYKQTVAPDTTSNVNNVDNQSESPFFAWSGLGDRENSSADSIKPSVALSTSMH